MIESEVPHIIVAELSHPGEKRTHNEDRYVVTKYRTKEEDKPALLAVVADGIGGHQAGEVAAQITVDTIIGNLTSSAVHDPVAQLREAVLEAGRAVIQASQDRPERQGMGSTVAVAWIIGARLFTASAGDSRIYLLRANRLRQITVDHTWIQEALDYNIIAPEEAHDHPQAHVLRRYIGGRELHEPDFRLRLENDEDDARSEANQGMRLQEGDQIVLCSDGLTDLVNDDEISEALQNQSSRDAVISLVDLARARGGHDNITTVVLSIPTLKRKIAVRRRSAWIAPTLIGILALFCFTALVLAASWWFDTWPWSIISARASITPSEVVIPGAGLTSTSTSSVPSPTQMPTHFKVGTSTIAPTPVDTSTPFPLPTVAPSITPVP